MAFRAAKTPPNQKFPKPINRAETTISLAESTRHLDGRYRFKIFFSHGKQGGMVREFCRFRQIFLFFLRFYLDAPSV